MVEVSNLSEAEIRYIRMYVFDFGLNCTADIHREELVTIALYDLIQARGYRPEAAITVMTHFKLGLRAIGVELANAKPGDRVKLHCFHMSDGIYASLDGSDDILNIKTMEPLTRCPAPMLTELVVLPELYRRVDEALKRLSDRRSQAAAQTTV